MVLSPATYEHTQTQTHTRTRKLTHMPYRHCQVPRAKALTPQPRHRGRSHPRSRPRSHPRRRRSRQSTSLHVVILLAARFSIYLSIYLRDRLRFPPTALENAARHDTRHAGARRRRRRHRPLVAGVSYRPDGVSSPASCCTRTTPCRRATTALELRRHCDAAALTKGAAAEAAAKAAATLAGRWNGRLAAVLLRSMCEQS